MELGKKENPLLHHKLYCAPTPGKKVAANMHSDNKVYNLNLSVFERENANAVIQFVIQFAHDWFIHIN